MLLFFRWSLRSKHSHPVRLKDGVLFASPEEVKNRWIKYFSEPLRYHTEVDLIREDIEQHSISDSLDESITESELELRSKK